MQRHDLISTPPADLFSSYVAMCELSCCSVLQAAALMKGKAGLEVSQAAVAPLETYHQIHTLPKCGCQASTQG